MHQFLNILNIEFLALLTEISLSNLFNSNEFLTIPLNYNF